LKIVTPQETDNTFIQQSARLLVDAFHEHWPDAWPTLEEAINEIHEMFQNGKIILAALDKDGNVLGIIGAIPQYDGNVWELHPLGVRSDLQRQGIGRALVTALEDQIRDRGGLTITLGTDDEDNMTSLSNVDLFNDPFDKIRNVQNIKGHPYSFYERMGYVITGVVPDANGIGKPDILMSKSLRRRQK